MKKCVLVLAKAYPPALGGVEVYSEQVAQAYARTGYEVFVLTQFSGPAGWSIRNEIQVFNVGPGNQAFAGVQMFRQLRRLLSQHQFEFIHATTWRVALAAVTARIRIPLFVTVHGREVATATGLMQYLMKWVFSKADRVLAISQTTIDYCSSKLPRLALDGIVSWNGISFPAEASASSSLRDLSRERDLTILCACRLVQRKNIASAIRAVDLLRNETAPGVRLVIAGNGVELKMLKQLTTDLRLEDRVTFLGRIPFEQMPELYRSADVFLHPQTHSHNPQDFESFCLAVVDAMSFGVPTIAGIDGAPREYIQEGRTGMLVSGSPESIRDALYRLMRTQDLRQQMGSAGQQWALSHLSWDQHVARLLVAQVVE